MTRENITGTDTKKGEINKKVQWKKVKIKVEREKKKDWRIKIELLIAPFFECFHKDKFEKISYGKVNEIGIILWL